MTQVLHQLTLDPETCLRSAVSVSVKWVKVTVGIMVDRCLSAEVITFFST